MGSQTTFKTKFGTILTLICMLILGRFVYLRTYEFLDIENPNMIMEIFRKGYYQIPFDNANWGVAVLFYHPLKGFLT